MRLEEFSLTKDGKASKLLENPLVISLLQNYLPKENAILKANCLTLVTRFYHSYAKSDCLNFVVALDVKALCNQDFCKVQVPFENRLPYIGNSILSVLSLI